MRLPSDQDASVRRPLDKDFAALLDYMIPPIEPQGLSGSQIWRHNELGVEIYKEYSAITIENLIYHQNLADGRVMVLGPERFMNLLRYLQNNHGKFFKKFMRKLVGDVFLNHRIQSNLSLPGSPPFPKGNNLPETDWSILEPVYNRGSSIGEEIGNDK